MVYGFKALNENGWLQIDGGWQGTAGTAAGQIPSANRNDWIYGAPDAPNYFTVSGDNFPQLYIRPDYTSWSGLGGTTHRATLLSLSNSGKTLELLTSPHANNWGYLTYSGMDTYTPATSGYGLEVYRTNGDLAYSSQRYAPIPLDVVSVSTSGGSDYYVSGATEAPPWVMINNCKVIKVEEDTGLPGIKLTHVVAAYWDPSNYRVGIQTATTLGGTYVWDTLISETVQAAILEQQV